MSVRRMTEEEIAQLISEKTAEYVATFRTYHEDSNGKAIRSVPCVGNTQLAYYPELVGQPLDALAISMIYALHPSNVRIVMQSRPVVTCNCVPRRVTIYLDDDDKILSIRQEVPILSSGETFYKDYLDRFGRKPTASGY
jgi:hypothetical protein